MNKDRRQRLKKLAEQIEDWRSELESIIEEEQEAFENLPESLQDSEKGEQMNEYIYIMQQFDDELESGEFIEMIDNFED